MRWKIQQKALYWEKPKAFGPIHWQWWFHKINWWFKKWLKSASEKPIYGMWNHTILWWIYMHVEIFEKFVDDFKIKLVKLISKRKKSSVSWNGPHIYLVKNIAKLSGVFPIEQTRWTCHKQRKIFECFQTAFHFYSALLSLYSSIPLDSSKIFPFL